MSIRTGLCDYSGLGRGFMPRFRSVRNVPQYAPKKEQGRNEKCKCGSGLKYKNCCGKSEKNAPVLERGQKVSMVLYNGKSNEEATKLHEYLKENKESETLLPLPGSLFKLLVEDIIVTETPGKEFADTTYRIELKGELK
jgi:hypothetical protein